MNIYSGNTLNKAYVLSLCLLLSACTADLNLIDLTGITKSNSNLIVSSLKSELKAQDSTTVSAINGTPPYIYALVNTGLGSVDPLTGLYIAPLTLGANAPQDVVIGASDTVGATGQTKIRLYPQLQISPATQVVLFGGSSSAFSASGGKAPYIFSLIGLGGAIDSTTIIYNAGTTAAGTTGKVRVTDSLGNFSDATVIIGNPISISPASVTLSTSGSQTFTASGGTGPYTYSVISSAGTGTIGSSSGVYVAPALFQDAVVKVTDTAGGVALASIKILPPSKLSYITATSAGQTLKAGVCSALVSVQAQDLNNNPSAVAVDTKISIVGNGLTFYSDSACTTAITSVTMLANSSQVGFYFKGTVKRTQPYPVIAMGGGLTQTSAQNEIITASDPVKLVFETGDQTVDPGACSAITKVQAQDAFNNIYNPVSVPVTISISNLSGNNLSFFSDSACTLSITQANIPIGGSTANFYFKGVMGGTYPLQVSSVGLTLAAQNEMIRNAIPQKLVWLTGLPTAQSVIAGQCSGVETIQIQDNNNNVANLVTPASIQLNSPGLTFFSDSACTAAVTSLPVLSGANSISFYYKSDVAKIYSISSNLAGYANVIGAPQSRTVKAGAVTKLFHTTPVVSVQALHCSGQVDVQTQDSLGNASKPNSQLTLNLSDNGTGITYYNTLDCTGAPITSLTLPVTGDTASFSFKATQIQNFIQSVASTGLTTATQSESITKNIPKKLAFSSVADQNTPAGNCSGVMTLQVQDDLANLATVTKQKNVQFTVSPTPDLSFYTDSTCANAISPANPLKIAAGASSVPFYFKGLITGLYSFTASDGDVAPVSEPLLSTVGVGTLQHITAAVPSKLTYVTPGPPQTEVGACSTAVTVEVRDGLNNLVKPTTALTLNLTVNGLGPVSFYTSASCTGAAVTSVTVPTTATSTNFYYKSNTVQVFTLTTSASGFLSIDQFGDSIVAATPVELSSTPVGAHVTQSVAAGVCSPIAETVQVLDARKNPVNATVNIDINLSSSVSGFTYYSDAACTLAITKITVPTGASTAAFYFKGTKAGSASLQGHSTSLASIVTDAAIPVTITPGLPVKLGLTTTSTANPPIASDAGVCSPTSFEMESQDSFGNKVPLTQNISVNLASAPAGVNYFTDATCLTPVVLPLTMNVAQSSKSIWFKSTVAGTYSLVASEQANLLSSSNPATSLVIKPTAPVTLASKTITPQHVVAGTCSLFPEVMEARDSNNNPSNVSVDTSITLSGGQNLTYYSDSACLSPVTSITMLAQTKTISFYVKGTKSGAQNMTGTVTFPGAGNPVTATTSPVIDPATAAKVMYLSSVSLSQSMELGDCSVVAGYEIQDQFGNLANTSLPTNVNVSGTGLQFFSNNTCTTPLSQPAVLSASASPQGSFYFKGTTAPSTSSIVLSSTGLTSSSPLNVNVNLPVAKQLVFATNSQTRIRGECSGVVTLQAKNLSGNSVANVTALTTVNLTSAPANLSFYSDSLCATPAITSVSIPAAASSVDLYFKAATAPATPSIQVADAAGLLTSPPGQTETINSPTPALLKFTAGGAQASVTQTACSSVVTVGVQDVTQTLVNVSSATTISLASTTPTLTYYSDSACTTVLTPANTLTVPVGQATAQFYFKSALTGTTTLTASSGLLTNASTTETIVAPVASKLAIIADPGTTPGTPVGQCSGIVTVQSQDISSIPANVTANTVVSIVNTTGPALTYYTDASCATTAVTSVTIPTGSNSVSYYFKGVGTGTTKMTVSSTSPFSATAFSNETLVIGPAAKLAFTTVPLSVGSGSCSALVTVQSQDIAGNPSNVTATTTVNLTDVGVITPKLSFYADTDTTCATPLTAISFAANSNSKSFRFKGSLVGNYPVHIAATGLTSPADQTHTIVPAPPNKLVFSTSSQTLTANQCSSLTSLQLQDINTNISTSPTDVIVTLASPNLTTYSDPACTVALSTLTILAGQNTGSFYFKGTLSGTQTLTANSTGLISITQNEIINPAAPAKLAFVSAADSVIAGGCSAMVSVQSQDTYGNPSNVTTATSITATVSGITLYKDSACLTVATAADLVIPVNSNTLSFYYSGTVKGTYPLNVSAASLLSPSAPLSEAIISGPAAKLVFTVMQSTLPALTCSTMATVESQDTFGNPSALTAAKTVNLSAPAGVTFYSNACITSTTALSMAIGDISKTFYFKAAGAATQTLTASVATGLTAATKSVVFTSAPPTQLAYLTTPLTAVAGQCSGVVTVELRDANNTTASTTGVTSLNISGAGLTYYSDIGCTTPTSALTIGPGVSSGSFYFKSTLAGTTSVIVSDSAAVLTATPGQTETIIAAAPTVLNYLTSSLSVSSGACAGPVTVQLKDAFGNLSMPSPSPMTLSLTNNGTGLTYYNSTDTTCVGVPTTAVSVPTTANSANFYFKSNTAQTFTQTTSGAGIATPITQFETITAGAPTKLVFATALTTAAAGACIGPVQLQSQDANSNPANVTAITTLNLSGAGLTYYSDAACATVVTSISMAANSNSQNVYLKGTVAGTSTLTAAATGLTSATASQTIVAGALANLAFTTQPAISGIPTQALSQQPIVKATDAFGNTVNNQTLSINLAAFTDNTCTTPAGGTLSATALPLSTSSGLGTFAGLTYSISGQVYIKASVGAVTACSTMTDYSAAGGSIIQVSASNVPHDGLAELTILIIPKQNGAYMGAGKTVELTANSATGLTMTGAGACRTAAATCVKAFDEGTGAYTVKVTSTNAAIYTWTAVVAGAPDVGIPGSAVATFNTANFVTLTAATTISSPSLTYDGKNLYITGGITTFDNSTVGKTYGDIFIRGGTVNHLATTTAAMYKLEINVSSLTIQSGGIDVSGLGYPSGYSYGPGGVPSTALGAPAYVAASHGGMGGNSSTPTYDDYKNPQYPGGGTSYRVSWPSVATYYIAGGGVVRINSAGLCVFSGTGLINANGGAGYGTAGGSVLLNCAGYGGISTGAITANGYASDGTGNNPEGGGGGGRIALISSGNLLSWFGSFVYPQGATNLTNFKTRVKALGGLCYGGTYPGCGGAGTIYLKNSTSIYGDMIIDNGGQTLTSTAGSTVFLADIANLSTVNSSPSATSLQITAAGTPFNNEVDLYKGQTVHIFPSTSPKDPMDVSHIFGLITSNDSNHLIAAAANFPAISNNYQYRFLYTFDHLDIGGNAQVELAGADLWFANGATSACDLHSTTAGQFDLPANTSLTGNYVTGTNCIKNNRTVGAGAVFAFANDNVNSYYLLHMDVANAGNTFIDAMGHSFAGTGSVSTSTAQLKFGIASLLNTGAANSYISTVASNSHLFKTGDFTIEFFVNYNAFSNYMTIADSGYISAGGWALQTTITSGKLNFYASGVLVLTESTTPALNTWYHYAIVRSGGNLTMYRDGVVVASAVDTNNYNLSAALNIGGSPGGGGGYSLNGYLDEVRIVKSAIYSGAFTPPAVAFLPADPVIVGYPGCSAPDIVVNGLSWAACDLGAANPNTKGTCWGTAAAATACASGYRLPTQAELGALTNANVLQIFTASYRALASTVFDYSPGATNGVACTAQGATEVWIRSSDNGAGLGSRFRYASTATAWAGEYALASFSTPVRCVK